MSSKNGGTGSADRSGFGCQQSIKRRQGVSLAKKRLDDYLSVVTRNGEGVLSVEFQIGLLETTWD
jgi:hypothetical protein|tara:strand:- start:45 stop:239 length:195 start_codon:yes stop_codon:yes gene_type:complete